MKLAVLSDIHANEQALDAVLADARAQGAEALLILGDLTTDGPAPVEVLRKLRALTPWIIRGNREEYLVNYHTGNVPRGYGDLLQTAGVRWTYGLLEPETIEWLQSLPRELSLRPDGETTVRMVHGSPFGQSDLLFRRDSEKIIRAARAVSEDVLLYGHNHEPYTDVVEGRLLLNPGAVGVHFNGGPWAEYGILTLEGGSARGELRRVPYDFAAFVRAMEVSGLLAAAPIWSAVAVESLRTGINETLRFLAQADAFIDQRDIHREDGMIPDAVWQAVGTQWLRHHVGWKEKALAIGRQTV